MWSVGICVVDLVRVVLHGYECGYIWLLGYVLSKVVLVSLMNIINCSCIYVIVYCVCMWVVGELSHFVWL